MKIYKQISIKLHPEDFRVKEVPSISETVSDSPIPGGFTILTLTKIGLTTLEVLRIIAEKLNLNNSQVRCLGLKDEDGLTEQIISIDGILTKPEIKKIQTWCTKVVYPNVISLELYGYNPAPLEVKKLHGNLFNIRLRDLTKAEATELYTSLRHNQSHTFINYYDQQRFGLPGGPYLTHLIGKNIVENDLHAAIKNYVKSGNAKLDAIKPNIEPVEWFDQIDEKKFDFFVSAYTSYLWNNKVSEKIALQDNSVPISIFENYSLYTSPTLKLPPIQYVDGFRATENKTIESYRKERQIYISTNVFCSDPDLTDDISSIVLNFFLPMGCYATMAVKQLLAVRLGTNS